MPIAFVSVCMKTPMMSKKVAIPKSNFGLYWAGSALTLYDTSN